MFNSMLFQIITKNRDDIDIAAPIDGLNNDYKPSAFARLGWTRPHQRTKSPRHQPPYYNIYI